MSATVVAWMMRWAAASASAASPSVEGGGGDVNDGVAPVGAAVADDANEATEATGTIRLLPVENDEMIERGRSAMAAARGGGGHALSLSFVGFSV